MKRSFLVRIYKHKIYITISNVNEPTRLLRKMGIIIYSYNFSDNSPIFMLPNTVLSKLESK